MAFLSCPEEEVRSGIQRPRAGLGGVGGELIYNDGRISKSGL